MRLALNRTNLNITGAPTDDNIQECATLSRLIHSLSSAYLLTGMSRYLSAAAAQARKMVVVVIGRSGCWPGKSQTAGRFRRQYSASRSRRGCASITWRSLRPLPPRTQITRRSPSRSATFSWAASDNSETGAVHRGQNRPLFEILDRFQKRLYLGLAQDRRELLFIAGQRYPVDGNAPVERVLVKEAQFAHGLNIGGELDAFFMEKEQLQ